MKEIGLVNKGACRMLLSKLYLATGQWEKAIQQLNEVIDNSGYSFDDEYLWYFCHSFQYRNVAYSTQCDLGFAPT